MRRIRSSDYDTIREWYKRRGLACDLRGLTDGYIIPGSAAGFIIKTNSYFCFLEGFITNPNKKKTTRHIAMQRLIEALVRMAQFSGFSTVFAITKDDQIKRRCKLHGALCVGENFTVWRKDI